MNIWFATNNSHKKKELEAVLGRDLYIPSENKIDFDPDETGSTFLENALIKARELKRLLLKLKINDPVIADDSGLCADGLGGKPGVLSARYGDTDGKKLTSHEKNILLLDELNDNPIRSARFVCAMVLLFDENRFFIAQETLEGEIVKSRNEIRGEGGFGYDPVFFVPGYGKTLAELGEEEKNLISHRGKAGRIISKMIGTGDRGQGTGY